MLDIVIVNWNAGAQLRECVDSLLAYGEAVVSQIIVVDNGSSDGSTDAIEETPGLNIIRTGANLGFAAACNIGAAECHSPYLLFLNPDTRVEPESLSVPLTFMERPVNSRVGVCGIQLRDESGGVSRSCARFPTLGRLVAGALGLDKLPGFRSSGMRMSDWAHEDTRAVDQVMGAFFLIRRELFESVGGFDERFFVYFEEVDLSFRCRQAGWESMFLSEAHAFHVGGGTSRQVKAHRLFYLLLSRLLYGFKHFRSWQAWILVGITSVLEPVSRTVWCLVRRDGAGARHTWLAYRMLWRGMGRIVSGEGRFTP